MKSHNEILNEWLWKFYREPWVETGECVWWAKKYNLERYWVQLSSFGWSAYNGWVRNTAFPPDKYERVEYHPWLYPPCWATVFWSIQYNPTYWHVAIVDEWSNEETLCTISQNSAGKVGDGAGDEIMRKKYSYFGVLWWYVPTMPESEKSDIEKAWDAEVFSKWKHKFDDYTSTKPITEWDSRKIVEIALVRNNLI
jgi:hypothetical protein